MCRFCGLFTGAGESVREEDRGAICGARREAGKRSVGVVFRPLPFPLRLTTTRLLRNRREGTDAEGGKVREVWPVQFERPLQPVTLPLGGSGSKARGGPSPVATASDPPASGRVTEKRNIKTCASGLRRKVTIKALPVRRTTQSGSPTVFRPSLAPWSRGAFVVDGHFDHLVALLDGINNVLSFQHATEHRVLAVQVRCRYVGDEKLRSICARTGIRHG